MDADIISVYTRQQAIEDGSFIDVTGVAKKNGFTIPIALTTNLFHSHIKSDNDALTNRRLHLFLLILYKKIVESDKSDNMLCTSFDFGDGKQTKVWAVIEPQSPTDPSPAMNIMLPEDY